MPMPAPTSDKVLAKILQGTDFTHPSSHEISLHTSDPGDTGANGVSGGSYARQSETFSRVDDHHYTNDSELNFTDMPACTVSHVAIWDGGGTYWWGGPLTDGSGNPTTKSVDSGDTLQIPANDLDITTAGGS